MIATGFAISLQRKLSFHIYFAYANREKNRDKPAKKKPNKENMPMKSRAHTERAYRCM